MFIAICISIFAITHNLLLIFHNNVYINFVAKHYNLYFPCCFLFIIIASVYIFFTMEYVSYLKSKDPGSVR
jgi:hypothetical protein